MIRGSALLAAAAVACIAPAVAQPAGHPVVLTATGPSARDFPAGRQFPPDARITLRPGDVVTLVRGQFARVFRGPGTFVAGDFATRPRAPNYAFRPRTPQTGSATPDADGPLSRFIICPMDNRCPR